MTPQNATIASCLQTYSGILQFFFYKKFGYICILKPTIPSNHCQGKKKKRRHIQPTKHQSQPKPSISSHPNTKKNPNLAYLAFQTTLLTTKFLDAIASNHHKKINKNQNIQLLENQSQPKPSISNHPNMTNNPNLAHLGIQTTLLIAKYP